MWSLKPFNSPPSICPSCSSPNPGFADYSFTGSQILGHGPCKSCGTSYFHNWPLGHGAHFPFAFTTNSVASVPDKAAKWLASPIITAVKEGRKSDIKVKREIRKKISRALLLNCLDPCFGHVMWKLLNAWYYRANDTSDGLVVVLPGNCSWLVPDWVAEIWSLDIDLTLINTQLVSLDRYVQEVSANFESIQVLPVATHPDHSNMDLSAFLKTSAFRLEAFNSIPAQVSFIWREDRWWLRSRIEEILSLVAIKFNLSLLKNWFLHRQRLAMIQTARQVRKQIPTISISVMGLGHWGKFPNYFEDLRKINPTEEIERKWCAAYACSQLVVGVHGSGMLIPTALSAGYIELLPRHKIPFMSEDIMQRHPPRFQTFLGRHLDLFSSPRQVATHICSVFSDFPYLFANTSNSTDHLPQ